jgi:L-fuculose-phosphate aldolase
MRLEPLRAAVTAAARRLAERGLVVGTAGNVSALDRDTGWIALTPTGVAYAGMTPADVCVVDAADGHMVEGRLEPSSELPLHLALYRARPDIAAVVHTHSFYAVLLGVLGRTPAPLHYTLALLGDDVGLAPYARYGTAELARLAVAALGSNQAVLLQNHGAVTVGADLAEAEDRAVLLEWLARLTLEAERHGGGRRLSQEEMAEAAEALRHYGQSAGRP